MPGLDSGSQAGRMRREVRRGAASGADFGAGRGALLAGALPCLCQPWDRRAAEGGQPGSR